MVRLIGREIRYVVISGFRREVPENCALLGCYGAISGNFLTTTRCVTTQKSAVPKWTCLMPNLYILTKCTKKITTWCTPPSWMYHKILQKKLSLTDLCWQHYQSDAYHDNHVQLRGPNVGYEVTISDCGECDHHEIGGLEQVETPMAGSLEVLNTTNTAQTHTGDCQFQGL
jgi:hypothetical protein